MTTTAQGFLGAGALLVSRFDPTTQEWLPYKGRYQSTKFEVKANGKTVEQTSRDVDDYGQVIESVALADPSELSLEMAAMDREAMVLSLLGDDVAYTQSGSTVTDEVVEAALDGWVQLAKHSIAATGFALKHTSGTPAYVEGTDYEVNRRLGMVKALVGGAITDGQSLKADYTAEAKTGYRIKGGVNAQLRAKIIFDGVNLVDNSRCTVNVWEAVLTSSAALDFLQQTFSGVPLSGKLKKPAGKDAAFEVIRI